MVATATVQRFAPRYFGVDAGIAGGLSFDP
jgi:hypothetical protein